MTYPNLIEKAAEKILMPKPRGEVPVKYLGLMGCNAPVVHTMANVLQKADLRYVWVKRDDDNARYLFAFADEEDKNAMLAHFLKIQEGVIDEAVVAPVSGNYIGNLTLALNKGGLRFFEVVSNWLEREYSPYPDLLAWRRAVDGYLSSLMRDEEPLEAEVFRMVSLMARQAPSEEQKLLTNALMEASRRVLKVVTDKKMIPTYSISDHISMFKRVLFEHAKDGEREDVRFSGDISDMWDNLKLMDERFFELDDEFGDVIEFLDESLPVTGCFLTAEPREMYVNNDHNTWLVLNYGVGDEDVVPLIDLYHPAFDEPVRIDRKGLCKTLTAHLYLVASGMRSQAIRGRIEKTIIDLAYHGKENSPKAFDVLSEVMSDIENVA